MTTKGSASRRREIPVDYVVSDPNGNRRARRMAAKEAKAARRGRFTGTSAGAQGATPPPPSADEEER